MNRLLRSILFIQVVVVLLVTTLTYLPNLSQGTIYRDDWYYMVDRAMGGPQTFHQMFRIDRPARAYFFEAYYRLFGVEPLPYHLATYAWRVLLGLAALWLFSLLWPDRPGAVLLITLLFLVYPGYTRWMEGIEDQPKVVSLVLQVLSYALTVKAVQSARPLPRLALWAGAVLTGWGYLALIDYAMGMEAFRFLCVFILVNRGQPPRALRAFRSLWSRALAALRAAAPGLLVLGGYFFWRVFLFQNERPETDIKLQLSKVIESPVDGLTYWFTHFLQSVANSAVVAWGGYGVQEFFKLSTAQFFTGLLTAVAVTACVVGGLLALRRAHPAESSAVCSLVRVPWQHEAAGLGLLGVIAGVIPVVMANRAVEFGILSHYGLPASLASAVLLVGLLYLIASQPLRLAVIAAVMVLASFTQYATSIKVVNEEKILGSFWHQLVWRAPGIREATSLLVYYPSVPIGEDVDFVHGPANFIYYLEPSDKLPIRYKLFAIKQYPWTVKEYLAGGKQMDGYRSHEGVIDYGYILAITQPTVDSCVRVIDQRWPWFSINDPDTILALGQGSNIRNVRANVDPPAVSTTIFGPEPEHGWCYTFAKAELALQQEDWQKVVALGGEAARLNLQPAEPLEWMPFLQAYAQLGDETAFTAAAEKISRTRYNRVQACGVLTRMQAAGYSFSPAIQQRIQSTLCLP